MLLRLVGYAGLAFAVTAASLLATVIARSPQTHDHIAPALRLSYDRTALDSVGPTDLPTILAELPEFSFPEQEILVSAPTTSDTNGQGHEPDPAHAGMDGMAPSGPAVQKVTVTTTEFRIDPDRLELRVGVPVELTVVNEGKQVHGIWIPDFGISEDIRSGKSKTVTFTPDKPGRIRYTCSYNLCGTEEEHNQMKGYITIK